MNCCLTIQILCCSGNSIEQCCGSPEWFFSDPNSARNLLNSRSGSCPCYLSIFGLFFYTPFNQSKGRFYQIYTGTIFLFTLQSNNTIQSRIHRLKIRNTILHICSFLFLPNPKQIIPDPGPQHCKKVFKVFFTVQVVGPTDDRLQLCELMHH